MTEYVTPSEEAIALNSMTEQISRALFVLDLTAQSDEGTNYKPLYYGMFNGVTSILRNAKTYEETMGALKQLQCLAEDFYIEQAP